MPYTWLAYGAASSSSDGPSDSEGRQWNALIGVVTAIVGNILISFALNLQRYAHILLDKERLQRSRSWVSGKGKTATKIPGYGTQLNIANERAELNREAPAKDAPDQNQEIHGHNGNGGHQNGNNAEDETTPLKGYRRPSVSSTSTLRQRNDNDEDDTYNKSYLKSSYWWAGICLMTVGEAGNFLAYGFAPASIVSPLGVVALISNCIIAPVLLKEQFRPRDFWGVVVAVAGAVTVVLSAKQEETKMGPQDVWDAITRWEFELYLGITAALIVGLMYSSGKYGHKTILIDLGLVGLFGGYTALSTKGVASLLSDTLWRAITFPVTYLLVFILVATAMLQIRYLNRALQRFDSTQVIPTQFVLFTLSVIIGSAVLYRDFESVTPERMAKFIGGCVLTFLGVYLITSGRSKGVIDDEEEIGLEEEGIGLIDDEGLQDALRAKVHGNVEEAHSQDPQRPYFNGTNRSASFVAQTPRRHISHSPQRKASIDESVASSPRDTDHLHMENPWLSQEHIAASPSLSRHSTSQSTPGPDATESGISTPRRQTPSRLSSLPHDQSNRLSLARKSMSRIVPGPIVTPLSSSLSGVVADALRNSPSNRSVRRRTPGPQKSRSQRVNELAGEDSGEGQSANPSLSRGHSEGTGGELIHTQEIDDAAKAKSRSRSLSQTIGALLYLDGSKSDSNVPKTGQGQGSISSR